MPKPQKISKLSVEEYLAFEETAPEKHEFVNGSIFAMAGATKAHNTLILNIALALRKVLKGTACSVYAAELKVHAEAANCFYYPDVVVDCAKTIKESLFASAPTVIFEVLSKSTAGVDRREKLVAYQQIPSLSSYVIVHQSRKRIDHYKRSGDEWTLQEIEKEENLVLECGNLKSAISVPVEEIYADIEFDANPNLKIKEETEVYVW